MASNTQYYNLEKPAQTDFYDVDVQNSNMDIIDTTLNDLADEVETVKSQTTSMFGNFEIVVKEDGNVAINWCEEE